MSRKFALSAVVVASLIVAACGDDDGGSSDTTAAGGADVTVEELSAALLSVEDLGEEWSETQRDTFTTREPENPSIDPSLWCDEVDGASLVALAGQEGADVELKFGGETSPFMVRQQAWSNSDVTDYFAAISDAVSACNGVTWTDDEGNSYTMGPTEVPAVGDESVSWGITIELVEPNQPGSIALQTVAKYGDVIMVVQGGASMDPDATAPNYTTIVESADSKMADAFN